MHCAAAVLQVFDSSLLRFAVHLTHNLDDKFGLPHKRMASLVSRAGNQGGQLLHPSPQIVTLLQLDGAQPALPVACPPCCLCRGTFLA